MELLDVLLDLFFFLSGIACAVTIIRKRKSFDLWVSFPACAAWIFKGMRLLCFDWFIHSITGANSANTLNVTPLTVLVFI